MTDLHGKLGENVYVEQPNVSEVSSINWLCAISLKEGLWG